MWLQSWFFSRHFFSLFYSLTFSTVCINICKRFFFFLQYFGRWVYNWIEYNCLTDYKKSIHLYFFIIEQAIYIHQTVIETFLSTAAFFFRKKSTIKMFFTSNLLPAKYESSTHNIAFFQLKKITLSESGEKYAQIKHCLQVQTVQTVLNKYIGGFWCEGTTRDGLFH